jgi:membrane protease YdiL (CAAX protease family)
MRVAQDVGSGLAAAALLVVVSRVFTRRTGAGRGLARSLAEALGPLSARAIAVLALTSGVAEELFFRGALQPSVGLITASVLFGLAHLVPTGPLALWSVFALAAGLLFGVLFEATGNLVAPVVAHVTVNAVNLHWLVKSFAVPDPGFLEPPPERESRN